MPTYSYRCSVCSAYMELSGSINDPVPTPLCTSCMIPMPRDYSAPAIIFKGEGFAANDLKGKK